MTYNGLDCVGLSLNWLEWVGMDLKLKRAWTGCNDLELVGPSWMGLEWVGADWIRLEYIGDQNELDGMGCNGQNGLLELVEMYWNILEFMGISRCNGMNALKWVRMGWNLFE